MTNTTQHVSGLNLSPATTLEEVLAGVEGVQVRLENADPALAHVVHPLALKRAGAITKLGDLADKMGVSFTGFVDFLTGKVEWTELEISSPSDEMPQWCEGLEPFGRKIDAVELLAQKIDPFKTVIAQAEVCAIGDVFHIIAPFDPIPLRRALEKRGFKTWSCFLEGSQHWQVVCQRFNLESEPVVGECGETVWIEGNAVHIDVSALEAPQPLVAVLRLVMQEDGQRPVIMHHIRKPFYLFPELAELGWTWRALSEEGGRFIYQFERQVS